MEPRVTGNITYQPDIAKILAQAHVEDGTPDADAVKAMAARAAEIARPKAVYREAYVDDRGEDWVVVDGVRLTSRVLRVNLEGVHKVYPYVATCGREMEAWAEGIDDILARWWADAIMQMALGTALAALNGAIENDFHPGHTSVMNPGSLEDWPIEEQRPFFQLVGDPTAAIGVRLTDSCLMLPAKSVSGLKFPTEASYENCQLCPRGKCPGRRAPYDGELFDRKYRKA